MSLIDRAILQGEIIQALNALFLSGQVGRTVNEPKTLTWDGDTTDAENVFDIQAVKISDEFVDLNTVSAVRVKFFDGSVRDLSAPDFVVTEEYGIHFLILKTNENLLCFSIPVELDAEVPTGLYLNAAEDIYHVESVTYQTETIHPIDPKFLPGPVLLDLTKYDANGPSLNDLVLSLFSIGGGKTSVNNTDGTQAFWKDANTDGRIQLMIDAASVKIVSDLKSTTIAPDGQTLVAIETSFLIQSAGRTARVTVMFGALSHTTDITLVVEFLTIPG